LFLLLRSKFSLFLDAAVSQGVRFCTIQIRHPYNSLIHIHRSLL
jgi:hypothetical protein